MEYKDLIKAHNSKDIEYDKTYEKLILPIKDPWENLDSIIEFLRIWNTRVPIGRNKEKIKEIVIDLRKEFEIINKYNLEDFEFTPKNIDIIKKIFDKLSDIKLKSPKRTISLKSTGVTKLMYALQPNLFVMWDKGILEHYGCAPNSNGYINLMRLMQERILEILKQHKKEDIIKETNRTLPKLIDEYNWINYRTSKSI